MSVIIQVSESFVTDSINKAICNISDNNNIPQKDNFKIVMKETKKRSCVKALTWRLVATSTTVLISYFYLNDISVAVKIGGIDSVIKFIINYGHERLYTNIKWGYEEKIIKD
jgi:uncharacterized membrane protein